MEKRCAVFLISFLIIVPIAFADISITTDQSIYNLGNEIKASASLMQPNNFNGLFKLTISCGNYKLEYYKIPVSLESNFRTAYDVELPITISMLGNCSIIGDLVTNDNLGVEEKESNSFGVTNQLSVLPVKTKVTALPGDSILISGVINEAFGNNVLKAAAKIMLDNSSYALDAIDGKFNITLDILKNIKSGEHTIGISASDSKGNSGSSTVELYVTAIPTYIKIDLSSDKLLPGSKIGIISGIYDQADDLINDSLNLELTNPSKNNVFRKIVQSNDELDYEFSQYAEPGAYVLAGTYKNLFTQSTINITTVREVKIQYGNETVLVENTGNVEFDDDLTFILESESKKYPLTKRIAVQPGKTINIDLSKEVPLGIYNVMLPLKEGIQPINETFQSLMESAQKGLSNLLPENTNLLAADVTIHDNRPLYKKIASSFASVTGTLVGSDGLLAKNPIIAPAALLVIVLLIVFRYGRKPIMKLIKGKKEEEDKNQ